MLPALCLAAILSAISASAQPQNNFVYQVFVRSFADDASDTDTIGDLRGLTRQLDYINDGLPGQGTDLEAGIVWLMPIFPSATYHGYDIEEYRQVNPEYGTLADLDALVREAHRRGIRVILDIAFNHTSNRHPWFVGALNNPNSPHRNFYQLQPEDGSLRKPGWHGTGPLRYFGQFGPNMPDLNLDHPAVRAELKSIARFWLDKGIDGFRLDAAKHIFDNATQNNTWWREFSDYVYSVKPDAVLVGEVLGSPETLREHAPGLDALLDEPFLDWMRDFLVTPKPGLLHRWQHAVQRYRAAGKPRFRSWTFLGSHDRTPRLASLLDQQTPARVPDTYRLAMYLLFTTGTHPVLYNGDELMQRGIKWRGNPPDASDEPGDGSRIYDETLREPFPWFRTLSPRPPQTNWFASRYDKSNDGVSVEEQAKPDTILSTVRALGRLRAQHPNFANGPIDSILVDTAEQLAFTKGNYLVAINATGARTTYRPPSNWSRAKAIFGTRRAIPPYGMVILQR